MLVVKDVEDALSERRSLDVDCVEELWEVRVGVGGEVCAAWRRHLTGAQRAVVLCSVDSIQPITNLPDRNRVALVLIDFHKLAV